MTTPAIVLATLRYRETSKIVRLATRDGGLQSVIARGASRPRSRFGAALQFLSEGQATYLAKDGRELHTLTAFDVGVVRLGLAASLPKYAAAAALAETVVRFLPAEANPETFDLLATGLAELETAPDRDVAALGLTLLWHLVGALGFAPAVEACARDGAALDLDAPIGFSLSDGGALCPTCGAAHHNPVLPPEAFEQLRDLLGATEERPRLDERHAAAHRRLLAHYIHYHLGEGTGLPAIDFWEVYGAGGKG